MLFSILIAQYNNGKHFKECFYSIISQTYKDFEVIIIDDCSTDNSVSIIKELIKDDSRFKLFFNETNNGCGFTKKRCVELATGEICGFLDPDDTLSPDALEKSINKYADTSIGLTYSKIMLCDQNLKPQKKHAFSKQIENGDINFFNTQINISHFLTFRKDLYLQTEGINPYFKVAEDMDLILKLYEKGQAKFIDDILYYYRIHNGGISSLKNKMRAKLWFTLAIYEASKRRKIPFDANFALEKVLGYTQKKQKIENTLYYKVINYIIPSK